MVTVSELPVTGGLSSQRASKAEVNDSLDLSLNKLLRTSCQVAGDLRCFHAHVIPL